MKIFFVSRLFHNVAGGVERMAIALMNELSARGYAVELLSWDQLDAEAYYPLDGRIVWHKLDLGDANERGGWWLRFQRQCAIRRVLLRSCPDVVIAFQHGTFLATATAALGLDIPIIAAERNAPQRFEYLQAGKRRGLIFQTFRLADCITVQLDHYVKGYPLYLRDRIVNIPNPVRPVLVHANPEGVQNAPRRLLSVGRLSYQKNQSALIEAFAQIAEQVPDWHLVLIGAGEDEAKLRQLVVTRSLVNRVEFVGAVKDVDRYYLDSHLFCLSSRWEGFPNALAEAMAHGLPAVGYAECAGVGQLIESGKTGLLAQGNGLPDPLAKTLLVLMTDDDMRRQMGVAAIAAVTHYAPSAIFDRWESLFKKMVGRS